MTKCKNTKCQEEAIPGKAYCTKHHFAVQQNRNQAARREMEVKAWPHCKTPGCGCRVEPGASDPYCGGCRGLIDEHNSEALMRAEARRVVLQSLDDCQSVDDMKKFIRRFLLGE